MTYLVFDDPGNKEKMNFLLDYKTKNIKQIFPPQKLNSPKDMFMFVVESLGHSTDGDTIIYWYDFMGILCWWLCRLKRINRRIIILNILLKDKNTLKNKFAKFLYKRVLKDDTVISTITSKEYGNWINQLLGLNRQYYLLRDIYYGDAETNFETGNSIFCGGRNGRDWDKLIQIAAKMPDTAFTCVMPKSVYQEKKNRFPSNIHAVFDVPENEFLSLLQTSSLIVMPLDTEAPAGLIVFFQGGMYKKMIITSDTATTREYITNERGARCSGDVEDWVNTIRYYINNKKEAIAKGYQFNCFLNEQCSVEIYAKTLNTLVEGEYECLSKKN